VCAIFACWFLYTEIYSDVPQEVESISFTIEKGESVKNIAEKLEEKQIIRNAWLFRKYVAIKGMDKDINFGEFTINGPLTIKNVASALTETTLSEMTITILPGWDLRDIGNYLEMEGIEQREGLHEVTGFPAVLPTKSKSYNIPLLKYKPKNVSLEGYLAPETYRVYTDATVEDIVEKLIMQRDSQFTDKMYKDIKKADRTVHEVLIIASLLEREVKHDKDRAKVADLFWRRYDEGWGLQADSTVHYVIGKKGDVFTTAEDRASSNQWNTYKHAGLPPGPISNPSIESIMGAIYPDSNKYWYFLTTKEGDVKFGKTLDEHNANVLKYIRS